MQIPNFINIAYVQNRWLWFHMLMAAIISKILVNYLAGNIVVTIVLMLAIAWEIYEYATDDVEKTYGSKSRFYLDAFGDITGALVIAVIVVS